MKRDGLPNPFERSARRRGAGRRFRGVFLGLRLLMLGGTLMVGALAFAGVRYYIEFAEGWAGSIDGRAGEPPPETTPRAWLVEHVLASGDLIMLLFWTGAAAAAGGVLTAAALRAK